MGICRPCKNAASFSRYSKRSANRIAGKINVAPAQFVGDELEDGFVRRARCGTRSRFEEIPHAATVSNEIGGNQSRRRLRRFLKRGRPRATNPGAWAESRSATGRREGNETTRPPALDRRSRHGSPGVPHQTSIDLKPRRRSTRERGRGYPSQRLGGEALLRRLVV